MAEKVDVQMKEAVAFTAYQMAKDLWYETHKSSPKLAQQAEFLHLVGNCSQALQGIKAYLPKVE